MKRIRLLDCTLRDGGFVNNWHFGEDAISNIFDRLELAGIDIIEVGYLRDYVKYDINETQFPDTASIGRIIPAKKCADSLVVAIIDYGNCSIDHIEPREKTVLDGIRVTFKRREMNEAIDFCRQIKEKGYLVSLQPVSFMDYSPQDVLDLVKLANELDPFAVCIVDTYGFMNKRDLLRYYSLMDATLNAGIALGYHSHNNFQLAYSNAIELMEQFTSRQMIVDSSVMGMGKGAGNAATELLALYLNNNMCADYDISQVLEIADTYIEKEKKKNPWGYSLKYYIAASNYCHHKYVSYLLDKKTLSIKSINEIISMIAPEKKTQYDEKYIVGLYREYQEKRSNDGSAYEELKTLINGRNILIVAPGSSIVSEKDRIDSFIAEKSPFVISVNHASSLFDTDAVFVSNHKRYSQIALRLSQHPSDVTIIATSNINPTTLDIDIVLNYSELLVSSDNVVADNAVLMLINALGKIGAGGVTLAGFDGYKEDGRNYYVEDLDFMCNPLERNKQITEAVEKLREGINIEFLTDTLYK